jgi:hypothetical protein
MLTGIHLINPAKDGHMIGNDGAAISPTTMAKTGLKPIPRLANTMPSRWIMMPYNVYGGLQITIMVRPPQTRKDRLTDALINMH